MLAGKRERRRRAASGAVLAALISCAVIILFSLASAKAAEARPERQAWSSAASTLLVVAEGGGQVADRADDDDCHGQVADNECCTGSCPFALLSRPAAPTPPSARRPLPETVFTDASQAVAVHPDEPPRRGRFARPHAAERA